MPSFKEIGSESVTSYYTGGVKVFLESSDDLYIFKNIWFSDILDKVRFESVSDDDGGSGGCARVIEAVGAAEENNLSAFGIVDRDSVVSDCSPDKNIFWEASDEEFRKAQPFGDKVHVLNRWEIENYLLKPEALSKVLSDLKLSAISTDDVIKTIIDIEDDLIVLSAMMIYCIHNKKAVPSDRFGSSCEGEVLQKAVKSHLSLDEGALTPEIEKIRYFSEDKSGSERWDRLNRVLDGKRSLNRIKRALSIAFKDNEERGVLATAVRNLGLIDGELKEFFDRLH